MTKLTGRTAVVTGGGRGIALALAESAARLVVAGRSLVALESTRDEIVARGGEAIAVSCDVTVPAALASLVDEVVHPFGSLDMLVNNAMQIPQGRLHDIKESAIEAAWQSSPPATLRRSAGGRRKHVPSMTNTTARASVSDTGLARRASTYSLDETSQ